MSSSVTMPPLGPDTRMRFSLDLSIPSDEDLLLRLVEAIQKTREVGIDFNSLVRVEDPEGSGARLTEILEGAHRHTLQAVCKHLCTPEAIPIVPHIGGSVAPDVREELLAQVFSHFAEGADALLLSDTLASMLEGELASLASVVSSLESLLKDPKTASAGVTVLGKLCERFATSAAFSRAISPIQPILQLAIASDSSYDYESAYISRMLGWKLPGPQLIHVRRFGSPIPATSGSSPPTPSSKHVVSSAYVGPSDELVTGGADGRICVWGAPGYGSSPSARFALPPSYVPVSMDSMTKGRVLLVACVAPAPATAQVRLFHCTDAGKEGANWSILHVIERDAAVVSYVKRIHNKSNAFVIAEEEDGGTFGLVFFNSQGVVTRHIRRAHDSVVTAMGVSPNSNWLVTASKDGVAKVWDAKGTTVTPLHVLSGHCRAVTAVVVTADNILTGGVDGRLCQWDIKRLKKPVMEKTFPDPILRAVLTGSKRPCVAVATLRSLTLLTLNGLVLEDVHPNVCATELRSNFNGSVLFGCGAHIDMFISEPPL